MTAISIFNLVFTDENIREFIFKWQKHFVKQILSERKVMKKMIKIMHHCWQCNKFKLCYSCFYPIKVILFSPYDCDKNKGYCHYCFAYRKITREFAWLTNLERKINLNRVKIISAIKY